MTITFVANFMNHHQLPFSQNMIEIIGDGYTFIALEPIAAEQLLLGYNDMNNLSFVIKAYETSTAYQVALDKILNDDIVIFGSCPNDLISSRLKNNKLSILYTERFFKKGLYRRFIPITYYKIYDRILKHKNKCIKIICSSAYAPYDFKLLGYKQEILKWGYFPEVYEYKIEKLISDKKRETLKILWVGRFIKFKHADDAIFAVSQLIKCGYNVELNIIGRGELEDKLKKMVERLEVNNYINFLGSMDPSMVRKYMEDTNIFLFTSDYNEGWGAVLNEAMNSGCAVIASHAIGSVPFLINDGFNGLIYKSGDRGHLLEKLKILIGNEQLRETLGINAYNTLKNHWNAQIATKRLFKLLSSWYDGCCFQIYENGPCSVAPVIDHKWYKG